MLKLTDCKTGEPVYVKLDWIKSSRRLPAEGEFPERTRIDTKTDTFLVREHLPLERLINTTVLADETDAERTKDP